MDNAERAKALGEDPELRERLKQADEALARGEATLWKSPSKWQIFGLDWRMIVDEDDNIVADVRTNREDADLIAAAPGMLAVLEYAVERHSRVICVDSGCWAVPAHHVIAKAKGER